jgi:hypothetical protein
MGCSGPSSRRSSEIGTFSYGAVRGGHRPDEEALRLCLNAIMHVPKKNELLDKQIESLVTVGDSPMSLRRLHSGFGRLFREEFQRKTARTTRGHFLTMCSP